MHRVAGRFFSVTAFPNLYCPVSAARIVRKAGEKPKKVPATKTDFSAGDVIDFSVDDSEADWTGEEEEKKTFKAGRLSFGEGYRPNSKDAVVHKIVGRWFSVTEFPNLYCPVSAAKLIRKAGE